MTFDEVKAKLLGKSDEPQILEVEKGASKRYAIATDDLNPLYLDEEAARASKYGCIVAPPGFYGWPVKQPTTMFPKLVTDIMNALAEAGFPDILDGGTDFEFFLPVRAGDILVCSRTLTDLSSRGGSTGRKMAIFVVESNFSNQNGRLVSRVRQTILALSPAQTAAKA